MRYEDLKYLSFPLPEAIVKEKWSGHFDVVRQDINRLLSEDGILPSLKTRLELELNSLDHIQSRYTISKDKALELLRQRIPEITPADLEQLRREDKADWMYLNGEIRYINNFHKTLFKVYPGVLEEMAHKKGVIFKEDDPASSEDHKQSEGQRPDEGPYPYKAQPPVKRPCCKAWPKTACTSSFSCGKGKHIRPEAHRCFAGTPETAQEGQYAAYCVF